MTGKHHVAVNFAILMFGAGVVSDGASSGGSFSYHLLSFFCPPEISVGWTYGWTYEAFFYLAGSLFFFWLGSLLPDIDSKSSTLGRYVRLPVEHRTITHTVWALLAFLFFSVFHPWLRFLWFGYTLHLLLDGVSAAGLCWTYPKKRYIVYNTGAFIAPGHKWKLYGTGKQSENRFAIVLQIVCWGLAFFFGCWRGSFVFLLSWIFS